MGEKVDTDAMMDQLEATLAASAKNPPPVTVAPAVVAPVTPVVEKTAEEKQKVDEAAANAAIAAEEKRKADESAALAEEDKAPERLRLKGVSEADRLRLRAARDLVQLEGGNISLEQAYARLAPEKREEAVTTTVPPVDLAALRTELEQTKTDLKNLAKGNQLFDEETYAKLDRRDELKDLIRAEEAKLHRDSVTQTKSANEKWVAAWEKSENWAVEHYPDASNPDSLLAKAVAAEIDQISGDPSHPLWGNTSIPQLLFAKHAAELGIAPKAKGTAAPATVVPVKGAAEFLPAPGGGRTTPVLDPETKRAQLQIREAEALRSGNTDELAAIYEEQLTGSPPPKNGSTVRFR